MEDLINREAAINAIDKMFAKSLAKDRAMHAIKSVPSAHPETDVLTWLLAYHTKSFELHGRYLPHEVIGWLVNDFSKAFIAERREE